MAYIGYPERDEGKRVAALERIDWSRIAVEPGEALETLGLSSYPREFSLEMLLGDPFYRVVDWDGSRWTLSAIDLKKLGPVSHDSGILIATQYARGPVSARTIVDRDQWTVPQQYTPFRPLHKISIADAAGTDVYVSSVTGQVVLATTRKERFWNWLGSVPHWLYFTPLRANPPLWRQVNLWVSGPAILIAISGIWIGVLRLRARRRYAHGTMSPYHGWKLWHHWAGILGGVFLLTWIVSGWLSVSPNQWLSGGGPTKDLLLAYAGQSAPTFPAVSSLHGIGASDTRQVHFMYVNRQPVLLLVSANSERTLASAAAGEPLSITEEQIAAASTRLMPNSAIQERARLSTADNYYYSHHEHRSFPVLRVTFDDAERSSFYLDPRTGAVLDFVDDGARQYRWWFNALHRLDFAWLLEHRTLWYAVIWMLCAAGVVTSISAVVIGWHRLRRRIVHSRFHVTP